MNMKKLIFLCCFILLACQPSEKSKFSAEEVYAFQKGIIHHKAYSWEKLETENFVIYVPKDSKHTKKIKEIGKRTEESKNQVLEILQGVKPEEKPVIFFLETRDQMNQLVGHPAGGWTETRQNTVFVVENDEEPAPLRHELGHLYSWRTWGKPMGYWLSEGVAVYAAGDCSGHSLHIWAAGIDWNQKSRSLRYLEENWDFTKAAPHLQAGSFVKYVIEKYGSKAFIEIWEKGMGASLEATGKTAEALEQDWLEFIRNPQFMKEAKKENLNFSERVQCEGHVAFIKNL